MGNYSAEDYIELFGGLPERGECIPDLDAIRDQQKYGEDSTGDACLTCGRYANEEGHRPGCSSERSEAEVERDLEARDAEL